MLAKHSGLFPILYALASTSSGLAADWDCFKGGGRGFLELREAVLKGHSKIVLKATHLILY